MLKHVDRKDEEAIAEEIFFSGPSPNMIIVALDIMHCYFGNTIPKKIIIHIFCSNDAF